MDGTPAENFIRGNAGGGVLLNGTAASFRGQNTIQNNGAVAVNVRGSSANFDEGRVLRDGTHRVTIIEGHGSIGIQISRMGAGIMTGQHNPQQW